MSLGGAAGAGVDQLTGSEGGEEKDEGRVGVQSNNRHKHQAASPPRGETWIGHGKGGGYIHWMFVYCEAVIREAAGRVGVPKQR